MNAKPRQGGQSMTEYLILTSLVALALTVGRPGALERLFLAFGDRYAGFTSAISLP